MSCTRAIRRRNEKIAFCRVKARYASELDEAKARIVAARSEQRDKHKDERKQEDAYLQARAREREQDRRAIQMQIDVVKKRGGITSFEREGPSII